MAQFPYVFSADRLKKFFGRIQTAGVPEKVTYDYLAAAGFNKPTDERFVSVFKFISFLDNSGVPTSHYTNYRDSSQAGSVLASCVRSAYADLFNMHPNANRESNQTLQNYFRPKSKVGQTALNSMVKTFKTLCELADFEAAPAALPSEAIVSAAEATAAKVIPPAVPVNINIQLTLPETKDVSIYEDIFKAMRKHLLKPEAKE